MGGLRIHESQVQRTPRSGAVRVSPGAFQTGNAQAWEAATRATAGALNDVSDVAGRIAHAEVMTDLSNRTRQRETLYRQTVEAVQNEPDPDKHASLIQQFESDSKALCSGLKGVPAQQWELDVNERSTVYNATFNRLGNERRLGNLHATNAANWESAVRDRDTMSLRRIATSNVQAGLWTADQATNELAKASSAISIKTVQNTLSDQVASGAMTIESAMKMLDHEQIEIEDETGVKSYTLGADDRRAMGRDLLYWNNQREAFTADQLRRQQEADRDRLLDALNDQPGDDGQVPMIDYGTIEATSLSETEKQQYWEMAQKKAAAKTHAAQLAYTLSDPAVELDFLQKIDLGKPVTAEDIYHQVGKGLGTQDAKELVNRLRSREKTENQPVKNILVQNLLAGLDDKHKAGYFLDRPFKGDPGKEKEMNPDEYLKSLRTLAAVQREFTAWVQSHPDATDEQISKKYQTLTDPTNKELDLLSLKTRWTQEGRRQEMFKYLRDKNPDAAADETAATTDEMPLTPDDLEPDKRAIWDHYKDTPGYTFELFLEDLKTEGGL